MMIVFLCCSKFLNDQGWLWTRKARITCSSAPKYAFSLPLNDENAILERLLRQKISLRYDML